MAFPQSLVDALLARALGPACSDAPAPAAVLMLGGAQASGKSTLAAQIVQAATAGGIAAAAASLDDFYLDLPEREALAARVHPLLATRGVPGTHDLPLLRGTLASIRSGEATALPRFDKGRDRRMDEREWPRIEVPLRLFVLEGWCLGIVAQSVAALHAPVNALEAEEDADGRWRRHVNDQLREHYMPLWNRPMWREFDLLVMLRAPSFAVIADWRDQPEAALRAAAAPKAMSADAIRRFVQHYQRLSEHALATLPGRADIVLHQDARRRVVAIDDHMPSSIDHPLAHRVFDTHEDAHD